ncbi:MAG TPA: PAS domain-containing protein [Pseudonocardia sp.]|nr:PAS domain-containing protein [Pseudonocardia sp.]
MAGTGHTLRDLELRRVLRRREHLLHPAFGWAEAELTGARYWDFVHPADQDDAVETGDRLITAGGGCTGREARRLCRDGRYRCLRYDLAGDRDAELPYAVAVDVGDRRPPLGEARVPVGTWGRDVRACMLTWSDELYAMYGLPWAPPSRTRWSGPPSTSRTGARHGAWRASLVDSDAHTARFRAVRPDGRPCATWRESTGRVIARSSNQAITIRGITLDVTDRLG